MRSIYIPNLDGSSLKTNELITVDGPSAHHLVKVVRIKEREKVLLLTGDGHKVATEISTVSKKEVTLKIESSDFEQRKHNIDVALALPKKDAVEDILRFSVELGINTLFPLSSEFSQGLIKRNDRLERIIESGMIQSNNPYVIKIEEETNISELQSITSNYDKVLYFCSQERASDSIDLSSNEKILLIIGPEAGFSPSEESLMGELTNSYAVHFQSYILRAPTAVCTATGYVLSKFK